MFTALLIILELLALAALGIWLWRHWDKVQPILSGFRARVIATYRSLWGRAEEAFHRTQESLSAADDIGEARETRLGPFRIIRELGNGTMTQVLQAVQESSGETVALKIPKPEWREDQKYMARFFRQAEIGEGLTHPNIMRVLGHGHVEGMPYLAAERLHGFTLRQILDRQPVLPVSRAIEIARAVARALVYAHCRGIVHRDIKPDNLMITRENRVVVMDFDVARATWRKGDTEQGTLLGTPLYMAPDQATRGQADGRADLYSLGVILFEMLTGRLPFEGDNFWKVLHHHRETPPPRPRALRPEIPPEVEAIILRLLEKAPERRHQTAEELLDDLVGILGAGEA